MSLLIVTSRYLKSGTAKTKSQRKNYTKYIATRESVEVREQSKKYSTENQKKLLNELLNDFPESKKYLEFEDYKNNPTAENASELISIIIERNADVIGNRQNFVGYMAMRPGVEKRGEHGLFNESNEPIVLDQIAEEVANHPGNVWSHIVSLRREDAIRLGYDNSDRWRELVMRHIADIAEQTIIPLCNLKWYGAFHDTTHHPHIHLIVYSTNPKQGFLTKQGIDKIRSVFANDIFHDELQSIYQEQTLRRDELKMESKKYVEQLVKQIAENHFHNANLENLILTLKNQLDNTKGKKVYGYLKPEVKKTVDEIFRILSQEKNISELYEKWCELERQKYKTYTQKEKEFPLLWENKVFQPVRNMIIQQVLQMQFPAEEMSVVEPELPEHFVEMEILPQIDEEPTDSENQYHLKWSDNYKTACKIIYDKQSKMEDFQKAEQLLLNESGAGNVLAIQDLGKLYSTDKLGEKDEKKSFSFYEEAFQGFMEIEPDSDFMFPYEPKYKGQVMKPVDMRSYVWYRIGKMHCYGLGTEQDYEKAFEWFLKSAQEGNKFAQYSLANLYYYGNGVEKDLSQAFLWYRKSSEQGQPYAPYAVAQMYDKGEYVSQSEETAQRYYKVALSGFLELESKGQADDNLYYKLGAMYKKGLGTEIDIPKAIEYFEKSAENMWSTYQLGRLYLFGAEGVEKDKEKAAQWLTKSANDGNEYAQNMLDDMGHFENMLLRNTVMGLFVNLSRCIEDNYSQKQCSLKIQTDRKLRKMIQKRKSGIGIREEQNMTN